MQIEPENLGGKAQPPSGPMDLDNPDFNRPAKLVAELIVMPDFPRSALGELVDIGGYTGVVVDIVRESLKVRSQEGATKSFNVNGLRRIYGPRPEPPPIPAEPSQAPPPREPARRSVPSRPAPVPVVREEPKVEPDFSKPVKKISEFVKRTDYPQCALGEHVEVAGFTGVVVQIVNRSLKVRSSGEITRSYNADALRRLYT
jgi:hypothetical protein